MILALATAFACAVGDDDDDADGESGSPSDSAGEDTGPEFDESCFAQVMRTQLVCACTTLEFDWSGLTHDSAGQPFTASDVRLAHWFIVNMPAAAVNTQLCAGGSGALGAFGADSLAGTTVSGDGGHATAEVGAWTVQTGVLALYDVAAADGSALWPRAAAIFNFDADTEGNLVVVEGRGDVYTAP